MSYHKQTAEFIATVAQNIPKISSDIMQGWIENPKGLQRFLTGLCPSANGSVPEFKVWKTIKLGTPGLKTVDDFRKALKDGGIKISDRTNDILGKPAFTVATEETELDMVVVSIAELGLKKGATREQIYARAKERGLDLCSAEVGPQLRLQYADQPNGEWLIIAMETIRDSDGALRLFLVEHSDNGHWLNSRYGYSDDIWFAGNQWVFVRPRK